MFCWEGQEKNILWQLEKWLTYKTKKGTLNLETQLEVHHPGPLIQVKVIVKVF